MTPKITFPTTFRSLLRLTLILLLITLAAIITRASLSPVAGAHNTTNVASEPSVLAVAPEMAPASVAALMNRAQTNDIPSLFEPNQPYDPAVAQAAQASAKQSLASLTGDEMGWRQLYPLERDSHAMAYDSTRGVVVLFGGESGSNYFKDTWEWDGQNWLQRHPTTSPSERKWHACDGL